MSKQPSHAVLSKDAVLDIAAHNVRSTYADAVRKRYSRGVSLELSQKYGVSQRAIRDVWNGRTWVGYTHNRNTEQAPDLYWIFKCLNDDI